VWGETPIARYKLPTALKTVPLLPRNASGKVLKHTLRKDAAA
jgi:acyl-coenzyme A synthetase/AMP-(fatty) acid ligase